MREILLFVKQLSVTMLNLPTGMGIICTYVVVYLPRWACKEQFLQAHWSGRDADSSGCSGPFVFVRCRWFNESASTPRPRINRPNFVLSACWSCIKMILWYQKHHSPRRQAICKQRQVAIDLIIIIATILRENIL